jgi:hypothetical protein
MLGNDREISNYTKVVTRQQQQKDGVFCAVRAENL